MHYLVLIGDIVASRDAKDRKGVQQKLESLLDDLNARPSRPVSPYTLTLGDEFQAVFDKADPVFEDMVRILRVMHPVRVRFSLGLGEITTELNTEQALGMDGPAFYRARDGMSRLKDSGNLVRLEGLPDDWAALTGSSLRLLNQRILKWDANRLAILHGLLTVKNKKDIAAELGITVQAVYKNINAGELDAVIDYMQALTGILNRFLKANSVTEQAGS